MHSRKRQDKFEANLKFKRKQKEKWLGIHEFLYKTGVGSGAPEGFDTWDWYWKPTTIKDKTCYNKSIDLEKLLAVAVC